MVGRFFHLAVVEYQMVLVFKLLVTTAFTSEEKSNFVVFFVLLNVSLSFQINNKLRFRLVHDSPTFLL